MSSRPPTGAGTPRLLELAELVVRVLYSTFLRTGRRSCLLVLLLLNNCGRGNDSDATLHDRSNRLRGNRLSNASLILD